MRKLRSRTAAYLAVSVATLLVVATTSAQDIEPAEPVEGLAAGAFNTHESQRIVRGLAERGIQNLWRAQSAPSVLYAAIGLAERNSLHNFQESGSFSAFVATNPDTALAASHDEFLLVLVVPSTDRFNEDATLVTLNVTGPLEPLELSGEPVESAYHCAISLTAPPQPDADVTD